MSITIRSYDEEGIKEILNTALALVASKLIDEPEKYNEFIGTHYLQLVYDDDKS